MNLRKLSRVSDSPFRSTLSKLSLEDYSERVKSLVDKATFDDQEFYEHMINCFIEGKTPEACAKFNEYTT